MNRRRVLMAGFGLIAGCSDDEPASSSFRFVPAPLGPGPAIGFGGGAIEGDVASMTLIARGLPDLFGFALELRHASALRLRVFEPSAVWPADSVSLARAPNDGVLHLAVAPKGTPPSLPEGDIDLANLSFTFAGEPAGAIVLVAPRCEVLARNGFPKMGVAFAGAAIDRSGGSRP